MYRGKQDLEAMRREVTGLLTERFQLEQCIRWSCFLLVLWFLSSLLIIHA